MCPADSKFSRIMARGGRAWQARHSGKAAEKAEAASAHLMVSAEKPDLIRGVAMLLGAISRTRPAAR